jgi:hypothetical protein
VPSEAVRLVFLARERLDERQPGQIFLEPGGHVAEFVAHAPVQRFDTGIEVARQQKHENDGHERHEAEFPIEEKKHARNVQKRKTAAHDLVRSLDGDFLQLVHVAHRARHQIAGPVFVMV